VATSLVHIGDFHGAPGPRDADRYRALDQIIREGLALPRLGAWVWPGDLFDAAAPVDYGNALDERLITMANAAPVVIVYGNHDRPGYLEGFSRLRATHPIYVLDTPQCVRIRLATGENATVFGLPYPHKAGLVGAGIAHGELVTTAADLLEPVFMVAAAELKAAAAAGDLTLMIGHVNVAGAQLSNGQPSIGHEIELNPKHLDRLGDIPKLLNHVHKPQEIAGAHYAGSVCRLDYGETEAKRYLVVTFYDEDTAIESRPIHVAPMHHIEGDLTREGFAWHDCGDGARACGVGAKDWTGCDVRVRYRYKASERAVISEDTIRALFASALRLKIESVAEPDRELRAPEVAAARTLPEKIAAFRKVEQLEDSVASKLVALEQGDQASVLQMVAGQLQAIERPREASVVA
jgi:Calcineurin-like phosphoesterase